MEYEGLIGNLWSRKCICSSVPAAVCCSLTSLTSDGTPAQPGVGRGSLIPKTPRSCAVQPSHRDGRRFQVFARSRRLSPVPKSYEQHSQQLRTGLKLARAGQGRGRSTPSAGSPARWSGGSRGAGGERWRGVCEGRVPRCWFVCAVPGGELCHPEPVCGGAELGVCGGVSPARGGVRWVRGDAWSECVSETHRVRVFVSATVPVCA